MSAAGRHAEQTGRDADRPSSRSCATTAPDAVLVYGDTNSTLAGALAAAKLGIPVAHVEAGLRSFDRRMPEEINRVVADHLSRWLFAPTPAAVANLATEGIVDGVVLVGDVHAGPRRADGVGGRAIRPFSAAGRQRPRVPGGYLFATIHRAENREPRGDGRLGRPARRHRERGPAGRPCAASRHARGPRSAPASRCPATSGSIEPQGYRTTLGLQLHAAAVLTDSGGVQREAAWLRVPCLVLRGTTEWVEAVAGSGGAMVVVGPGRGPGAT